MKSYSFRSYLIIGLCHKGFSDKTSGNMMYKISIIILSLMILPHFSYARNACAQILDPIEISKPKEEKKAQQSGYTEPGFYIGLNALHHITELGKHLKDRLIDPKITHIANLIFFIYKHLSHIRKGLIATHQQHKLSKLNRLKQEALDRIRNQQVTLHWWQLFNIRLAALASLEISEDLSFLNRYKTHDTLTDYIENTEDINENLDLIRKALSAFPKKVILPTTSHLGTLALNVPPKNGLQIVPAELSRQTRLVDGVYMTPIEDMIHEFDHIIRSDYGTILFPENPELNKQIVARMEELPQEERKKAEVIYWILTHELFPQERPTLSQITDSRALLQIIHLADSIPNPLAIFAETQLLDTLNSRNVDIYRSRGVTDIEVESLFEDYQPLLEESVNIFTRTARTALKTSL